MDSQYGIGVHADSAIASIAAREPGVQFDRGAQHRAGVERRVSAHGELPGGAGGPDPADGLGQERLRAPRGTGRPTAQPAEQHLTGLGAGGQLRVVAADPGVAEPGALLAAAIDRHERGVQIQRQRRGQIGGSGTG